MYARTNLNIRCATYLALAGLNLGVISYALDSTVLHPEKSGFTYVIGGFFAALCLRNIFYINRRFGELRQERIRLYKKEALLKRRLKDEEFFTLDDHVDDNDDLAM